MTKPFLILQLRPEDEAADGEFHAFLEKGELDVSRTQRVRLERDGLPEGLNLDDFAGVVVGGGPGCISDAPEQKSTDEARAERAMLALMPEITRRDMPFLGCCYGIGILAHHLGANVSKERYGEAVGPVGCTVTPEGHEDPLLAGLPENFHTLVGHKEAVQSLPPGTVHLMRSDPCPFQMIRYGRNVYATQFHPEADGDVFADRIRIYKDRGYFPPETADALTEAVYAQDVSVPSSILKRFFKRYN